MRKESESKVDTEETSEVVIKENVEIVINEQKVYIGPTIPGVAAHGTVYVNGIPETLESAINKYPTIGNLVINLSDFAEAMKDINGKRGPMYTLYEEVKGD